MAIGAGYFPAIDEKQHICNWNCQPESLSIGVSQFRRTNPNNHPLIVDEWATAISRIDSCIRLNVI